MANWFRNSLSEDNADRYNYNWAVWLFLLLTFISLLFPLSPVLKTSKDTSTRNDTPRVEATCWCPAQFENSQVDYTLGYCSSLATAILQGVNTSVDLFEIRDFPEDPVPISEARKEEINSIELKNKQIVKRKKNDSRLHMLINFLTPIVLFSMALFLKLPQILRALLSGSLSGCINIDQALESCIACQSIDPTSQQKLSETTVLAVSSTMQSSKSKATYIYLSMKILALVVVFTEALFISQSILADIEGMKTDYENFTEDRALSNGTTRGLFIYPDDLFHCRFFIRQLTILHDYMVQCKFHIVEEETSQISNTTPKETLAIFRNILHLYQALFTIALACLVLLIILNIISTISWFIRLSSRSFIASLALPRSVPNDLALLVHMAWINASPIVAKSLAANIALLNDKKASGEEMEELKE